MVGHGDFSRLTIEFEEDRASSIRMSIADSQQLDDQSLPRLDINRDFFASLQTKEECRRREDTDV